jgi:hypothetical protein
MAQSPARLCGGGWIFRPAVAGDCLQQWQNQCLRFFALLVVIDQIEIGRQSAGKLMVRIGLALFVVFLSVVLAAALPLKLLDPAWQLLVIATLVNNGTIAVLGFVLIALAPLVASGSGQLRRWRDRIASLACLAAIGYLLIIPLQGLAAWRGVQQLSMEQGRQLRRGMARIEAIRSAVHQARSTADLQSQLKRIEGMPLPPLQIDRPLASFRPQLLSRLGLAETALRRRYGQIPLARLMPLVEESLRVMMSAMAYGMAFASGARWSADSPSLLDAGLGSLGCARRRLRVFSRLGGSRKRPEEDYIRQLSGERDENTRR